MSSIYDTQKKADKMAKDAFRDPAMNPAGKAQYQGKVRVASDKPVISTKPDPAHAARIRAKKSSAPQWAQKAMQK